MCKFSNFVFFFFFFVGYFASLTKMYRNIIDNQYNGAIYHGTSIILRSFKCYTFLEKKRRKLSQLILCTYKNHDTDVKIL